MAAQTAAMGFSAHSGWAAMVVLSINAGRLSVLARSRFDLIDARDPDSKFPYHTVEFLDLEAAALRLTEYMTVAEGLAYSAINAQHAALGEQGFKLTSVGILDSLGRKPSPLATTLASHALIHGAEGAHFRNALSAAAQRNGLKVYRTPARTLENHAVQRLHLPLPRVLDTVNGLGRQVGPPWGADQKKAALLAWTMLTPSGT
ncbi:MAG: hypothetical protein M3O26_21450 [Pseudomonadota bacterium]|nr:hypothetical protein [Pseudomonadota bacterium]